jgi:hypothetical protein
MPWADTANGLYKIRNAANSDWITLYQLDGEWTTIALENGTAAAPSLYFKDSGTDTGIYSPGVDQVGIATGGVQRVNFNAATEVVFNDGGADVDFRIEGDTKANLFKVDAGTDAVSVDGDFSVTGNLSGTIRRGTAVALTSGTAINLFTSIPNWVKRITVMFADIRLSGTAHILIQLGDSGGFEATGYVSSSTYVSGGFASGATSSTTGLILYDGAAINTLTGTVSIVNLTGENWIGTGTYNFSSTTGVNGWSAGNKTLSSTLDRVRITTSNGTDTFDAGTINILYEG